MTPDQLRLYRRYALRRALINRADAQDPARTGERPLSLECCHQWRAIARKWKATEPGPDTPGPSIAASAEYWENYKAGCTPAAWFRRYKSLDGWLAYQDTGRIPALSKAECLKRVRAHMTKYNVSVADLTGLQASNGNGQAASKSTPAARWRKIGGRMYQVPCT